jgi:hypothetical protein
VETNTYRFHALLEAAKLESDEDIHLVIADPRDGRTMIAEFPNPSCTIGASATARSLMRQARAAFIASCGLPGNIAPQVAKRQRDGQRRRVLPLQARAAWGRAERD